MASSGRRLRANAIIEELQARGFLDSEISVLFPDREDPEASAAVKLIKAPAAAAVAWQAWALAVLLGFSPVSAHSPSQERVRWLRRDRSWRRSAAPRLAARRADLLVGC
jgi:hypothetical protein